MSPINWYVAIGTSSCFGWAYALRDNHFIATVLVIAGCAAIVTGGVIAIYFAFHQPDRLQSEDHITVLKQLDMIASKGGKIVIKPVELPAMANPYPLPTEADATPKEPPTPEEAGGS